MMDMVFEMMGSGIDEFMAGDFELAASNLGYTIEEILEDEEIPAECTP